MSFKAIYILTILHKYVVIYILIYVRNVIIKCYFINEVVITCTINININIINSLILIPFICY